MNNFKTNGFRLSRFGLRAARIGIAIGLAATFSTASKAVASNGAGNKAQVSPSSQFYWPERLSLANIRSGSAESNPMEKGYDYATEFKKLDLKAVKADIAKVLTTSQDWWPADYGTYAPFFIRMAWHSAGTYRTFDGRGGAGGGQLRFEPLNSWPDNANLDKARRLVWPIKQKYGNKLSWADLMVLTGNVALESMGFKTFGFAGGREDDWEPEFVDWGPEMKFLADERYAKDRKLKKPLGAVQMGLIYVNPEGPNGVPDPQLAANDIRETFGRMAMNDEETVALIAGGHTFGKAHGAAKPEKYVGAEPAAAGVEAQGFGWKNKYGTGKGKDTITSGLEGAWTSTPTQWSSQYLTNLMTFEWVKTKSPAGAIQWIPKGGAGANLVPDAHDKTKRHAPIMFTTDIALKVDPEYNKIVKRFIEDPEVYRLAFAKAWFKLTHRDMGPKVRYLGPEVPSEDLIWQDPIPKATGKQITAGDVANLKKSISNTGLTVPELVRTAWAAASSYRHTDMRGGANGGRLRLAPQKDWAVNNPTELAGVLSRLENIQAQFNKSAGGKKVSMADLIVLAGVVGIENAAKAGGLKVKVPFTPGRTDASQEQTDVESFQFLEPKSDAFRNYYAAEGNIYSPTESLVDRAIMLDLTVPEMTVLVGGMRVLNANAPQTNHGVFTDKPGTLSNDFFVNLLDMSTEWRKVQKVEGMYEGVDRKTGTVKWQATPVDLIFGSQSELRAVSELYAQADSKEKFARDFVSAWNKVMMVDRFELKR